MSAKGDGRRAVFVAVHRADSLGEHQKEAGRPEQIPRDCTGYARGRKVKTCPHCGMEGEKSQYANEFDCGTFFDRNNQYHRTKMCEVREPLFRELTVAKGCITALEEAGDNVDTRIGCGCGASGPCSICASVSEAWAVAKCRKTGGSKSHDNKN